MKKAIKILVCTALLALVCALTCSCEQIDEIIEILLDKPNAHVCSYDQTTVVSELFCDRDGIITRTCDCGRVQTEITSAYGHSFGEWETVSEPSCDRQGSEQRVCETCGSTEERAVNTTYHDYTVTEVTEDGETKNRYYCNRCGESFDLKSDIALPEYSGRPIYLFEREIDFSFKIICPEPEDYIREHLRITDAYFDDPQNPIDYNLTSEGDGVWTVSPVLPYSEGASFAVRRSGGVVLLDFGLCELIFSVKKEETKEIIPTGEVIYLAALEDEDPGYYPYNLDFSESSGDYFLALEKADGLSVGDLICVGNVKSFDELLSSAEDNTFGRIRSLSKLSDGRTLAVLSVPDISELLSEINIYSSLIEGFYDMLPEKDIGNGIKNMLYSDPDFADMLSFCYTSAEEYLELRGLSSGYADFTEFLEAVETEKAEHDDPEIIIDGSRTIVSASCGVNLIAGIPVMLGREEIGILELRVTVYVNINGLSASLRLEKGKFSVDENKGLEFTLGITEDISAGYTLDITSRTDYDPATRLFAFDISTGLYHFTGCEHIDGKITVGSVTVYELYELITDGEEISECEDCLPVKMFIDSMVIIDADSNSFHRVDCAEALEIPKDNLIFSERSSSLLSGDEHSECKECGDENTVTNSFINGIIALIELGERGKYADIVGDSLTAYVPGTAIVGKYVMTFSGIDRQSVTLSVGIDFKLYAASHYSFEMRRISAYGFIGTEHGPRKYGEIFSTLYTKDDEPTDEIDHCITAETFIKAYVGGFMDTVNREIIIIAE
nr:hypothetical protein [Oscillospiraceae bacterium]